VRGPDCDGRATAHRYTFASWALAAGISMFDLARFMGTSVKIIDRHYGHLVRDSEESARARLNAYAGSLPGDQVEAGSHERTT